jgi:hypothetical protein
LSGRSVTAIDILALPSLYLTALITPSMEGGYTAAAAAAIPTATASPRGGAKPPMQLAERCKPDHKRSRNPEPFSNEVRRETVLREDVPIAQLVERKKQSRSPDPSSGGRPREKSERPVSIFLGVHPFWQGDSLVYRFRVQYMGKQYEYGKYKDENMAALARDYATLKADRVVNWKQESEFEHQSVLSRGY